MLFAADSLFARLRSSAHKDWTAYIRHSFVKQLGDGTLPQEAFQRYLVQDYLFLIHFARAYALAAYKSRSLTDIRQAAEGLHTIADTEMRLHVELCEEWGLTEEDLEAEPEAQETLAYTRYVLEAGSAGDVLDLYVALSPCVVGYAEIGSILAGSGKIKGNPYRAWIEMYASDEYQSAARAQVTQLDRLMKKRGGEGRFESLASTFREATLLETAFWDMGLRG
jgi:thiaminase (transcriptional activator TenA)